MTLMPTSPGGGEREEECSNGGELEVLLISVELLKGGIVVSPWRYMAH